MIKLKVNAQHIVIVKNDVLTTGSVGESCEFIFSEDWSGLGKTAIFTAGEVSRAVAVYEDKCVVPWECLTVPYIPLTIAVYGAKDGKRVIATEYCEIQIKEGAEPEADETGLDPSLPYWAQMQVRLANIKGVVVSAYEPEDRNVLWIDTSDRSSAGEIPKEQTNLSNIAYGYADGDFEWDVSCVNDVFFASNTFSLLRFLRTEAGQTSYSVNAGAIVGPFYYKCGFPFDSATLELAGTTNTGGGIMVNTGYSRQFVRFYVYYPAAHTITSADYMRVIVRGRRGVCPKTPGAEPDPVYKEKVLEVIHSYMDIRNGYYVKPDGTTGWMYDKTDMSHRMYYYGRNFTHKTSYSGVVNIFYRESDALAEHRAFSGGGCIRMECDTFALMCLCLIPYELTPYAVKTDDGSDWYYKYYDYATLNPGEENRGSVNIRNWNPWTAAHPDPLPAKNYLQTLQGNGTEMISTYHHRDNDMAGYIFTAADTESFLMWHYGKVFKPDAVSVSTVDTGDLVFFRKYEPDKDKSYYDLISHVGVISIEPVNGVERVILNHVTDHKQTYDLGVPEIGQAPIVDKCTLHRVLFDDFVQARDLHTSQYFFARPYTEG